MADLDHVHILARPDAGGKRATSLTAVIEAGEALGFVTTVLSAPRPEAIPAVLDSHREGMQRLVIVGGDGLIHHALPFLATSSTAVGIVPSGTGNDFARGLGIGGGLATPASKRRTAIRNAFLATPRPIDLIESDDGRFAASVLTAGFSGRVTARANPMRFPPGQSKYTVATLLEAARLEPVPVRFRIDGEVIELDTAFFAIGNTRFFGGGMAICPNAVADDGLLEIVIVPSVPAQKLLRVMPTVFVGRHINDPAVLTRRAAAVEIETDEPLWADGEQWGSAPVSVAARSRALRVAG